MKTDTPRTDAKMEHMQLGPQVYLGVVTASFARELERENNKLREEIDELKARLDCSSYDSGRANP